MAAEENKPINLFEHLDEAKTLLKGKDVFVFLDYDGTLTPIVETPDKAVISGDMRRLVQQMCSIYTVSVVSGRATDDVRGKMKIDGIFYAGSHGFEIVDPDGKVEINQKAKEVRGRIDEAHQKLKERLSGIRGALAEHVKYTISAHYRLVSDEDFPKFKRSVEQTVEEYPDLRMTSGKKVFEIRPKIDWDKGKAVEWILNVLEFDEKKNKAIYIGDDTTDEDAFAVLKGKGFGIVVADPSRPSHAKYSVKDTDEVKKVLEFLINLKK